MKTFDREALSDYFDSISLAKEIHRQFGINNEAAPLYDIASQVGIWKIREESLSSIEGALVVPTGKIEGEIILNSEQIPERKRFTLAHEIGHFVHPMHHPDSKGRFNCSNDDIFKTYKRDQLHLIEDEANEFASELLVPTASFFNITRKGSNLDFNDIISFCDRFEVSKAYALRKLQPLCTTPTAFVFSRNGFIRYIHSDKFPFIKVWSKNPLPLNSASLVNGKDNTVLKKIEVDANIWLQKQIDQCLYEQLFIQENGYRITMLTIGN